MEGARPPPPASRLGRLPLMDWIYIRTLCLHRTPAAAAALARDQLVTLRAKLTAAEAAPLTTASASCLVVYNHERHASAAIRDLQWERGAFAAKYDGPRMARTEAAGAARDGADAEAGAPAGPIQRVAGVVDEVVKRRDGGGVRAARAPEASDVLWDHMTAGTHASVARFLRVWLVCVVALGVSVALLFMLARFSEKLRRERLYCTPQTRDGDGNLPNGCEEEGVRLTATCVRRAACCVLPIRDVRPACTGRAACGSV